MASTLLVCRPFHLRFWSITQDEPALEAALTFILGQTVSGLPHCYTFLTRQVLVYIAVPTAIYPVTGVCAHVVRFGKDRLAESLDYTILVGATRYRRKCWGCWGWCDCDCDKDGEDDNDSDKESELQSSIRNINGTRSKGHWQW